MRRAKCLSPRRVARATILWRELRTNWDDVECDQVKPSFESADGVMARIQPRTNRLLRSALSTAPLLMISIQMTEFSVSSCSYPAQKSRARQFNSAQPGRKIAQLDNKYRQVGNVEIIDKMSYIRGFCLHRRSGVYGFDPSRDRFDMAPLVDRE